MRRVKATVEESWLDADEQLPTDDGDEEEEAEAESGGGGDAQMETTAQ